MGLEKKGNEMSQQPQQGDASSRNEQPAAEAQRQQSASEEGLIGDQTHDHKWWGPTGRPTERKGLLAGDDASRAQEDDERRPSRALGHDSDWRDK